MTGSATPTERKRGKFAKHFNCCLGFDDDMDIFAILDLHKPPEKLKWSEGGEAYFHFFSPPLPPTILLFTTGYNIKTKTEKYNVKVSIESTLDDKKIGEICSEKPCLLWQGNWSTEETDAAKTVHDVGRMMKISVCNLGNDDDEGICSQDSTKEEYDIMFGDDEISQFEKSMEKFEEEFKENKTAINKLHRKVNSEKPPQRKVSDFFKSAAKLKKQEILCESSNKREGKFPEEEMQHSSKRICPFGSDIIKSKKQCAVSKTHEPDKTKSQAFKKSLKKSTSFGTKFSDFLSCKNPSARWGHVFCKICDDKAVLIGGQGFKQQMNPDSLWTLDIKCRSWTSKQNDNPSIDRRMGHTAIYDEKARLIYVFGGSKRNKWYNDVHTLDVDTWKWEKIETIGKAPTRAYHTCTKFYDEMLVFGGVYPNPDPEPDGCSDELFIFDIENKSWYTPIVNGEIPDARSGHSACILESKLFIFGGWDSPTCFNDLYSLDIGIMNFSKLEPIGKSPSPRTWHSTTLLDDQKSFCIYGGYNGLNPLDDVFLFNSVTTSWSKISKQSSLARAGHKAISYVDETSKEKSCFVLVFGGGDNDGEFYDDMFKLCL